MQVVIRISTNRRQIINTSYQLHGHTLEVVDSSKYLGVTIREDLTWRKHIEDTATKANKTLGFVRRNLSECTSQAKSQRVYIPSEVCCLYDHGTSKTRVLLHSLGSSPDKRCPHTGTSPATSSQIRPSELYPAYPRMCDKHGSEPWMGVLTTTTIHGQVINAFQDPAWTS